MNFTEFTEYVTRMAQEVKEAQRLVIPELVETAALRFVDDNFRSQSWEGQPWASIQRNGTILVKTGFLRRGFESQVSAGRVRIFNEVKYAVVHNEGFSGIVQVPQHKRSQFKPLGGGRLKKTGEGVVKAHSRRMSVKPRQFAPTEASQSPTLTKIVTEVINIEILKRLQP